MLGGGRTEIPFPPKIPCLASTGEPLLAVENISAPSGVSGVLLVV